MYIKKIFVFISLWQILNPPISYAMQEDERRDEVQGTYRHYPNWKKFLDKSVKYVIDENACLFGKSDTESRQEAWDALCTGIAKTQHQNLKQGYQLGKAKLVIRYNFIPESLDLDSVNDLIVSDLDSLINSEEDIKKSRLSHAKIWLALMIYKRENYYLNKNKNDSLNYAWKLLCEAKAAHATRAVDTRMAEMIVDYKFYPENNGRLMSRHDALQFAENLLNSDADNQGGVSKNKSKTLLERLRNEKKNAPTNESLTDVNMGRSSKVNDTEIKNLQASLRKKIEKEKHNNQENEIYQGNNGENYDENDGGNNEPDMSLSLSPVEGQADKKENNNIDTTNSLNEVDEEPLNIRSTKKRFRRIESDDEDESHEASSSKKQKTDQQKIEALIIEDSEDSPIIHSSSMHKRVANSDTEEELNNKREKTSSKLNSNGTKYKTLGDLTEKQKKDILALYQQSTDKKKARKTICEKYDLDIRRLSDLLILNGCREREYKEKNIQEINKDAIMKLHSERLNSKEIAEKLGYPLRTVQNVLRNNGMPTYQSPQRVTEELTKKIIDLYKEKKGKISLNQIREELKIRNRGTISKVLDSAGLRLKNMRRKNLPLREDQKTQILSLLKDESNTYSYIRKVTGATKRQFTKLLEEISYKRRPVSSKRIKRPQRIQIENLLRQDRSPSFIAEKLGLNLRQVQRIASKEKAH